MMIDDGETEYAAGETVLFRRKIGRTPERGVILASWRVGYVEFYKIKSCVNAKLEFIVSMYAIYERVGALEQLAEQAD